MEQILKEILAKLGELQAGQERIETKLDAVYDQTAILTEFRTEVNSKLENLQSDLTTLEAISGKNLNDIALLKRAK
jgi:hypothetical protein